MAIDPFGSTPPQRPVNAQGKSGCLNWGVTGCGGAIVIMMAVILGVCYRVSQTPGFKQFLGNVNTSVGCAQNLTVVSGALNAYTQAHKGKYPPKLSALVPEYLPDSTALGCGATMHLEYTPPPAAAAADYPVVTFRTDEVALVTGKPVTQFTCVRLLKDGRTVTDSITRLPAKKTVAH